MIKKLLYSEFYKINNRFQCNCKKCVSLSNKTKHKFTSDKIKPGVKHDDPTISLINKCFTCDKKLQPSELREANNSFQYNCKKCTFISNKIQYIHIRKPKNPKVKCQTKHKKASKN